MSSVQIQAWSVDRRIARSFGPFRSSHRLLGVLKVVDTIGGRFSKIGKLVHQNKRFQAQPRRIDHRFPLNSICRKKYFSYAEILKKNLLKIELQTICIALRISAVLFPKKNAPEYCNVIIPFSYARSMFRRPCQTPRNRSNQHSQRKSEVSCCAHLIIT